MILSLLLYLGSDNPVVWVASIRYRDAEGVVSQADQPGLTPTDAINAAFLAVGLDMPFPPA